MKPNLHHTPGRLRIKSLSVKRNPHAAADAANLMKSRAGVVSCDANIVTGSLVIRYKPAETDIGAVLRSLQDAGHVERTLIADQAPRRLEQTLTDVGEFMIKALVLAVIEQVARRSASALIGVFR